MLAHRKESNSRATLADPLRERISTDARLHLAAGTPDVPHTAARVTAGPACSNPSTTIRARNSRTRGWTDLA
ncbi:hypothetical protein ABZ921_01955 [Streptomyces atriruber]|uniref:Uncharacterized protein n=1 Tax=Streptomyces atriruber TaxID=545121 RepID=A0ABV3BEE2_9ACTN